VHHSQEISKNSKQFGLEGRIFMLGFAEQLSAKVIALISGASILFGAYLARLNTPTGHSKQLLAIL
jgi:hypothetical protein